MQSASAGEIRNAVLALRSLEDVVIFRAGSARRSREQWQEILQTTCSLGHDRRHYDFSGKLEIADWWEISYQPDKATSYAYSNTRQPLHTDNAWFADPAEINFFLMEKQASSGGEQMIYRLSRLIEEHQFDAAIGGARRDEERSRAKERIFSLRDAKGQWDPKNQRPELWNLYNGKVNRGESIRVFPLSNWTELDIWQYIERESVDLPSIYFAHRREVVARDGMLLAVGAYVTPAEGEEVVTELVRFRTVGDMSCTGAVISSAGNPAEVIAETAVSRITERGATRADDRTAEAAMEDRKREGYF